MNLAPITPITMLNLYFDLKFLKKYLLITVLLFGMLISASKTQAAFVPESSKGVSKGGVSAECLSNTYAFLAGLSNREIEKLSGKSLTFREKAGLNMLRRQYRKGSNPPDIAAALTDKCFSIYLKNGDVLEVKLIQITPKEIKYQRCNKPDDPEIIISKDDVFSVKDSNGEAIYSSMDEKWKKGYEVSEGETDRLALAAGITGIVAVTVGLFIWPIGLAAGIAAGIMGIASLKRFKANSGLRGQGWAITGIVASGLWLFFAILVLIALAAGW